MKLSPKKGFTLIEVVIVLAIAALIMVIVFLAVQGAQRSQRDNAIKNAGGRVLAAAETYASNNQGRYPTGVTGDTPAFSTYLTGITPVPTTYTGVAPTAGQLMFDDARTCINNVIGNAGSGGSSQMIVVWYSEVAGAVQCQGN